MGMETNRGPRGEVRDQHSLSSVRCELFMICPLLYVYMLLALSSCKSELQHQACCVTISYTYRLPCLLHISHSQALAIDYPRYSHHTSTL